MNSRICPRAFRKNLNLGNTVLIPQNGTDFSSVAYGAHKGTLSVVILFISFVRNNISFVRNIISFVRNIISFVQNNISFVRNDFVCTKYYFVCTE